jgi:hypothetical protein
MSKKPTKKKTKKTKKTKVKRFEGDRPPHK